MANDRDKNRNRRLENWQTKPLQCHRVECVFIGFIAFISGYALCHQSIATGLCHIGPCNTRGQTSAQIQLSMILSLYYVYICLQNVKFIWSTRCVYSVCLERDEKLQVQNVCECVAFGIGMIFWTFIIRVSINLSYHRWVTFWNKRLNLVVISLYSSSIRFTGTFSSSFHWNVKLGHSVNIFELWLNDSTPGEYQKSNSKIIHRPQCHYQFKLKHKTQNTHFIQLHVQLEWNGLNVNSFCAIHISCTHF